MALPPQNPAGHKIPLAEAAEMTRRYRAALRKGGMFHRGELDELLAQADCVGMRFYYGRGKEGEDTLILVGVNGKGEDMIDGVLLDIHLPCPPFCTDNVLNS